jgi:hypothetical protein
VEGWKPGHFVRHGNWCCGNRRLRDSLGWLIVNADDCLNVKRRDFISQKPMPQLGYRSCNDAFGVSLASMSFRDCDARVEASKAVHGLNRDHNRQSRHRLTIKPHIGEPWNAGRLIYMQKKIGIKFSGSQADLTIEQRLLK